MKFKKENVQAVYDGVVKHLQRLDDDDRVVLGNYLLEVKCADEVAFSFSGSKIFLSQAIFFAHDELLKTDFSFGKETLKMLTVLTGLKEGEIVGDAEKGEGKDENVAN